ncbi:MFS general substrate transporter [Xylona heveae TC161]|uniref:MFS general substrate transporter n=1 Tax=Xylona heveae (strain CBS 132557 / TC161) TaxID=1328760 RepID=A0A165GRQ9_XYLHT|nr:MFS general substrate transporter [Xylona heveae TC161]KZF22512.1 MFS general substrate transporter [Xylona heveae TC161]
MANKDPAQVDVGEERPEVNEATQALAKRVLRKIDLRILTFMFVTYNFNFMDKIILSSAAVFGLSKDTHLHGTQYSWISSIFYFGYLVFEYPTTLLIQKLPIGKFLFAVLVIWGAIVACTAACSNFGGLAACRFFLGVAEATISPAFVYITSMWYTRDEIPTRTGVWFAGNSCGGFIASLLAYAIGQITHPLAPWQWMFIIFGVATSIWGIFVLFLLPDTINDAKFLTEEEKQYAEDRVVVSGTGRTNQSNSAWKKEQVLECLLDPKTWFFAAISVLTQIPNGGTGSFGNLALKGFGFTSLQTTLMTLPASVISMTTILATGWLAGRFRNATTLLIVAVVIPPVVGSALIFSLTNKGVRLFAYYCLQTGPAAIPLALGLVSANYKGVTKKMTVTAILFVTYCAGNIAGPQTFISSEASRGYPTAFKAILICYGLVILIALAFRAYLTFVNLRRDKSEGLSTAAAAPPDGSGSGKHLGQDDYEDVTDFNTLGFRYRM